MQIRILLVLVIIAAISATNCNSGKGKAFLCDTSCMKDTLKLVGNDALQPYVYFSAGNCKPDTITWSYRGLGANRKLNFSWDARLSKNFVSAYFKDTSYIWVKFNDCVTGRGYLIKLPFDKKINISSKTSAINGFDPKFSVADGLVAYTDGGNVYVEDESNGQQAMMTFGKKADFDYDAIHATLDSVHITRDHIWTKVKLDNDWKVLEKNITLK